MFAEVKGGGGGEGSEKKAEAAIGASGGGFIVKGFVKTVRAGHKVISVIVLISQQSLMD